MHYASLPFRRCLERSVPSIFTIVLSDRISFILATTTTLGVLALALTTFRVWHRFRKRHLWWDDYWAIISQFFNLINCVAAWFRDDDRSKYIANIFPDGTLKPITS
jgi:hypothetical protein